MRYEFKYLVPIEQYEPLKTALMPFLKRDKFAAKQPKGLYTVRSIYFDTPGFDMYQTKIEGIAHRMKVRLRGYNVGDDNSEVFMEIKRKYEGPILKNRSDAAFGLVKKLFNGASFEECAPLIHNPDNARRFFYQMLSQNLQPVVNVIYEREPFLASTLNIENDFRCTFDMHLRSVAYPKVDELFVERNIHFAYPGFFILEVKFNQYCPTWVKPVIEDFQLRKEPASKYVGTIDTNPNIKVGRHNDVFAKTWVS
jgi:hypothetical protein